MSILIGLGCGSARTAPESPRPAPPRATSTPLEPRTLDRRELLQPLTRHVVRGPEGQFRAEVEAKSRPTIVKEEQGWTISADLGTGAPLKCTVFAKDIEPGAAVSAILDDPAQRVTWRKIGVDEVELIGRVPVMRLRAVYSVDEGRERLFGELKLFVLPGPEFSMICGHDEVGYRKTFARITRQLAESFSFPSQLGEPRVAQVHVLEWNGAPVGFQQYLVYSVEDKGFMEVFRSTEIVPVAPAQLRTLDETTVTTSDKDRRVLFAEYQVTEGRRITLEVALERKGGRHYHYEGTVKGKRVAGDFTSRDEEGLPSQLWAARARQRALGADTQQAITLDEYHPDIDLARPGLVTYQVDPISRRVLRELRSTRLDCAVDEQGRLGDGTLRIGARQVKLRRVHAEGTL